jgi:hypothetical protein
MDRGQIGENDAWSCTYTTVSMPIMVLAVFDTWIGVTRWSLGKVMEAKSLLCERSNRLVHLDGSRAERVGLSHLLRGFKCRSKLLNRARPFQPWEGKCSRKGTADQQQQRETVYHGDESDR